MFKNFGKTLLISSTPFLILVSGTNVFAYAVKAKKENAVVETKKAPFNKTPLIEDTTFEEDMLETNRGISVWFDQLADSIDLYLVGHRVTTKPNNSRIVIENTTYSRESNNLTNLTNISINPAFPNLEKYWNLKFTTYDDTNISRGDEKGYARATPRQNYAATVGIFRKFDDVRVAYEPRIEIRGQPQLSHFLTFDTVADYGWLRVNPKLRPFASSIDGTGAFQALNFNFDISPTYTFTWLNEGEYQDKRTLYSVTNGFSIAHPLTDKTAISYGVSFYSNNKPVYHLDAYSISFTWSEVVYKDVMDYQITPHIDFTRDEEFRGFVGLIFGFRVYF